jgi:transcriptional regulator with XRE-family HTH domain
MVLLRRVLGDALRARRQGQHRTLREVSTAANVSLGYLSEIERGQKEASSELLSAICDALGAQLSELLREVSDTLALAEDMDGVLVPVRDERRAAAEPAAIPAQADAGRTLTPEASMRRVATDGSVSVSVRQETPLKATLRATRNMRPVQRDRDFCAA